MTNGNPLPDPPTTQAPADPPGSKLLERVTATMQLQAGSFRAIADFPNTLQSLLVFLIGYALAGSLGTLIATFLVIYPLFGLVLVVFHACVCRFVTGRAIGEALAYGLPSYPDWIRAQMFTAAPLVFGIVPFVGGFVGGIWCLVLQVFAIKDMSGCTTGKAVLILLIAVVLPLIVLALAFFFGLAGLLGLGSLASL